jgi:hypothetical protein
MIFPAWPRVVSARAQYWAPAAGFHADAARRQEGHHLAEVGLENAVRELDIPLGIRPMELQDIL